MCEELGFDSVWVRDHLIWHPHGMEKAGLKFVEPFVTLSAVAAVTKRIGLGIAVLVPVRWPLKVSQDLASLSYIAGGRVIAGLGLGFNPAELATVGMRIEDRVDIMRETVEIARLIWKENNASYKGKIFSFENVTIEPKPTEPIPFFGGGSTLALIIKAEGNRNQKLVVVAGPVADSRAFAGSYCPVVDRVGVERLFDFVLRDFESLAIIDRSPRLARTRGFENHQIVADFRFARRLPLELRNKAFHHGG